MKYILNKKNNEYIVYDVTSFSSYGKSIEELEWGYNRDKERLPQINMGMYYGEESGLPLYYRIYPGGISDKAHLKYMAGDNLKLLTVQRMGNSVIFAIIKRLMNSLTNAASF